jgi:hypothetical protein
MITWCVPESVMPAKDVYNKQPLCFAGLASQKSHMAVYLMSVYGSETERTWFESAVKQAGKKLDMGKSCVRFRSLEALPLDVIGEAVSHISVDKYVETYRSSRANTQTEQAKSAKSSANGASAKASAKIARGAKVAQIAKVATAKKGSAKVASAKGSTKKPAKATSAKGSTKKPAKHGAKNR